MKNTFITVIIAGVLLLTALGCGITDKVKKSVGGSDNTSNTNPSNTKEKSISDKTIDIAVGDEKVGVPECDDLLDYFARQTEDANDSYVTKATRQYFMNKIRESIKQSIEENKGDKAKMAKECKEYRRELDKFKAEEDSNKK